MMRALGRSPSPESVGRRNTLGSFTSQLSSKQEQDWAPSYYFHKEFALYLLYYLKFIYLWARTKYRPGILSIGPLSLLCFVESRSSNTLDVTVTIWERSWNLAWVEEKHLVILSPRKSFVCQCQDSLASRRNHTSPVGFLTGELTR